MAGVAVRASTANAETGTDKPATIPERRSGDAGAAVAGRGSGPATTTVEIVIPVHNEQRALPGCVEVLTGYLSAHFPFDSIDRVRVLRLGRKGRGLALRSSWSDSTADVVMYMDVDLSTGLDALLPLVASVVDGHSDIAIGSRLAPGARTIRGAKREVISRCYNALILLTHGARFSDARRDTGLLWQVISFGIIGGLSTVATLALYALFRDWWTPVVANLVALVITTLFNTEANRHFTFIKAPNSSTRVHFQGLLVFAGCYALTSTALLVLHANVARPSAALELTVLLSAYLVGTAGRFFLLRAWVFKSEQPNTEMGKSKHVRG
ncbi:MAG TPA: GtrA family protein [Pseudonocardiaceae bacterium]|jgi:putative flippase GtrA